MATMDIVKLHGDTDANFVDVGGSASQGQDWFNHGRDATSILKVMADSCVMRKHFFFPKRSSSFHSKGNRRINLPINNSRRIKIVLPHILFP